MQLAAARVFVRDIVAARDYYEKCLGLELGHDGTDEGFCRFDTGQVQLVVELVTADEPPEEQAMVGRFTGLSFGVDDVMAAHAELAARGVRFVGAPERQFWGGWLATLVDPDGNEMQLVQFPG
ncbi:VOC family protein [Aquabacterium sp. OR-4]|uniref:VOC family protein n=1 Tax=Aquabacterium sp. OR-4 TaxID=2978127 RepID=UPI0021B47B88|nr:VOC family protein [Aquabacterium sp. OR-4]MDT7835564.1 VOC family protein [Aquabacterium sp. OR-4]